MFLTSISRSSTKVLAIRWGLNRERCVFPLHPRYGIRTCIRNIKKRYYDRTLPETNIAPENRSLEKEIPIWKPPFLGAMLVFIRGWSGIYIGIKPSSSSSPKIFGTKSRSLPDILANAWVPLGSKCIGNWKKGYIHGDVMM